MSRDRTSAAARPTRVAWCLTTGSYVDDRCEKDHRPHDHHDIAIDYSPETGQGRPLYRLDPVGTTYLLPDGGTLRLVRYVDDPFIDEPIEDRIIPRYDWWSPEGGAAGGIGLDDIAGRSGGLWDGVNLRPGVWRTVPVSAVDRPAVGSVWVTPQGETWRLRNYGPAFLDEGGEGRPSYTVMLASGMMTNGNDLPDGARLVWAP